MRDFSLLINPGATPRAPYGDDQAAILNADGLAEAWAVISSWPGYAWTPLINLTGLAREASVSAIYYKDEGLRFHLKSFKPLGGAYAVARLLMDEVPALAGVVEVTTQDLLDGIHADACARVTVTAATDGNHGRSVAWGAQLFGCRCVIFINEAVSAGREAAIAAFGAEVQRNPGSFDDAVRQARKTAAQEGWHVIPDTAAGANSASPRHVTQGYGVMAAEAIEQLLSADTPPTHVFVQAGVGGMASATCAQFWQAFGTDRPRIIVVEPFSAACWFESLRAGQPTIVAGELESLMGGLACGEISDIAWPILKPGAYAAMMVADANAADVMRLLAVGVNGDPPIVAGESGVAGLAGFLAVSRDENARRQLGLDSTSRVMLFGTEGATDAKTYAEIVGRHPEDVAHN